MANSSVENPQPCFPVLAVKTMVCHTTTYFIMGALAAYFLNYAAEQVARTVPLCGIRVS